MEQKRIIIWDDNGNCPIVEFKVETDLNNSYIAYMWEKARDNAEEYNKKHDINSWDYERLIGEIQVLIDQEQEHIRDYEIIGLYEEDVIYL